MLAGSLLLGLWIWLVWRGRRQPPQSQAVDYYAGYEDESYADYGYNETYDYDETYNDGETYDYGAYNRERDDREDDSATRGESKRPKDALDDWI